MPPISPSEPLLVSLSSQTGALVPATSTAERRLSHMRGMFLNHEVEAELIAAADPLLYQVFECAPSQAAGQLKISTTVLEPGKVGAEYFMTKGHYHVVRDRAEIY